MNENDSWFVAVGGGDKAYSGEALLWETPTGRRIRWGRVAVDLGSGDYTGRAVSLHEPDIVVLTHDDGDHVGGWDAFARTGLRHLRELWVPVEWGVLLALLEGAARTSTERDRRERSERWTGQSLEETYLGEGDPAHPDERPAARDGQWRREAIVHRARSLQENDEFLNTLAERLREQRDVDGAHEERAERWQGTPCAVGKRLVHSAVTISRIILDALASGVGVRYFSVEKALRDGRLRPSPGLAPRSAVTIANAHEVGPPRLLRRPPSDDLAHLLALTIQNRRALTPVLWAERGGPTVIVWSDTSGQWIARVKDLPDLLTHTTVTTAPHHGSSNRVHDRVWKAMKPMLERGQTVVVSAGGESSQGVHPAFLAVPVSRRACTRCRHVSPAPSRSRNVVVRIAPWTPPEFVCGDCRSWDAGCHGPLVVRTTGSWHPVSSRVTPWAARRREVSSG